MRIKKEKEEEEKKFNETESKMREEEHNKSKNIRNFATNLYNLQKTTAIIFFKQINKVIYNYLENVSEGFKKIIENDEVNNKIIANYINNNKADISYVVNKNINIWLKNNNKYKDILTSLWVLITKSKIFKKKYTEEKYDDEKYNDEIKKLLENDLKKYNVMTEEELIKNYIDKFINSLILDEKNKYSGSFDNDKDYLRFYLDHIYSEINNDLYDAMLNLDYKNINDTM